MSYDATMSDLYQDPEIYELAHDHATEDQIRSLIAVARQLGIDPVGEAEGDGRPQPQWWLEPACGSGRLLRGLCARGYSVAGFDRAPEMIRYARDHVGTTTHSCLFVADMESFVSELSSVRPSVAQAGVSLAYNLINTLRHLETEESLQRHLGEMSRVLHPNGYYLVGLSSSDYDNPMIDEDVWTGERHGMRVTQVVQGLPPRPDRSEEIISHVMIENLGEGTVEHRDERYTLRTYSLEQWQNSIEQSPLEIAAVFDIFGEPGVCRDGGYSLFALRNR